MNPLRLPQQGGIGKAAAGGEVTQSGFLFAENKRSASKQVWVTMPNGERARTTITIHFPFYALHKYKVMFLDQLNKQSLETLAQCSINIQQGKYSGVDLLYRTKKTVAVQARIGKKKLMLNDMYYAKAAYAYGADPKKWQEYRREHVEVIKMRGIVRAAFEQGRQMREMMKRGGGWM